MDSGDEGCDLEEVTAGTIGDEATRERIARADLASPVDELLSRRVAREFCVQTVAGVVVGDDSGYRELLWWL